MARLNLQPDWVEDLLGIWSTHDIDSGAGKLGHRRVSPMFAMLGVAEQCESEDVGGYSNLEVLAVAASLEKLRAESEPQWQAIHRSFRPWAFGPPADVEQHLAVLRSAATRLAQLIDIEMGD